MGKTQKILLIESNQILISKTQYQDQDIHKEPKSTLFQQVKVNKSQC